ncbi:MAG: 23S rRNA (uracil(1939)-C(5))-methyltransferase RlmD [Balneolaceae bacterium]|nr:23S rRNA (uracil(1939)-C(5))-methyltransferase RlmD [Balneolaceae bacterium]MBO6546369.1 23S rRNA (uracil(1939)-C(5))-methyltransferase RlmD [Balneolaceae bacterium]MBO6648728.1 23S rRNA (uracil(1939)-C(5))-methyltransferase RlmD [Balneolaceae bacterium]
MSLKKGHEVTLKIEGAAFKGKGIGKVDGMAVFVSGTMPGDEVRTRIIKRKKNFREGKLLEIVSPSPDRIKPVCQHANVCGGCSWQHVPYEKQLEYKTQQVTDHIRRIGGLDTPVLNALGSESELYYRNKMEYSVSSRRWLTEEEIKSEEFVDDSGFAAGLHAPGRFDKILNLNECHLQRTESFQILDFVRTYCLEHDIEPFNTFDKTGYLRHVMIRTVHHTEDFMVNLVTFKDEPETIKKLSNALLEAFPIITTILNNVNDQISPTSVGRFEHVVYGPGFIRDKIGDFEFKIHPNAFFQTNTAQAEKLYKIARDYAELEDGDVVYDLYCGVGTLSLFMSQKASKVVGIELVEVAVENAKFNAIENSVENVSFIKGDMKDVFTPEIVEEFGAPDVLITDPPRAGMHPDVVARLCELKVPRMVYVSCESSTMARDLKILSEVYDILEIQPVDMFPQTYHVEAVAKLRLKKNA